MSLTSSDETVLAENRCTSPNMVRPNPVSDVTT